jgi:hypothetical protein
LQPAGVWQHVRDPVHAAPPLHEHTSLPPCRVQLSPRAHVAPLQAHRPVALLQLPPEPFVRHLKFESQPQRFAGRVLPPHTKPDPPPCAVQSLPHPPQLVALAAVSHPLSAPEAGSVQFA